VCSAVLEVTGESLDMERITSWTHVLDTYGEEATTTIFERVFDPGRVRDRKPYPGAPEVLRALQESYGIEIHFVTHNDPGTMAPHLRPWLRTHFGPNVGLTVTTEDKLGILEELGAFGLVDDRPDILERVAEAGLWAAAMTQPWNRDLLTRRSDVHGFSHWQEVPDLLPSNLKPVTFPVSDTGQGGGVVEREGTESMREDAPRIEGFLGRGSPVTVSARTGVDLAGYVCDQNENGLLLDARDSSGDPTGYEFLPWSSIERVSAG
jgi:hypothetical protein